MFAVGGSVYIVLDIQHIGIYKIMVQAPEIHRCNEHVGDDVSGMFLFFFDIVVVVLIGLHETKIRVISVVLVLLFNSNVYERVLLVNIDFFRFCCF